LKLWFSLLPKVVFKSMKLKSQCRIKISDCIKWFHWVEISTVEFTPTTTRNAQFIFKNLTSIVVGIRRLGTNLVDFNIKIIYIIYNIYEYYIFSIINMLSFNMWIPHCGKVNNEIVSSRNFRRLLKICGELL